MTIRDHATEICQRTGAHPLTVLALMVIRYPELRDQITAEIDACLARTAYTEFD